MVPSYPYLSRVPAELLARANRCMICRVFGGDETRLELSRTEPGLYDPLALVGLYPTFEAALRDAARLAALTAWDDEQHRFYHDATLVPGSPEWERQYAKQAVLWGRLLKLLEAQRSAASPAAAKPQD